MVAIALALAAQESPDFAGTLFTEKMRPARGTRPVLALLWDPHRSDHPAPPRDDIDALLFGPRPSVADWFRENSGARFEIERAGTLGWFDAAMPADHYWGTNAESDPADTDGDGWLNGHVEKWAEAIRAADAEFDYAARDADHDGRLDPQELAILVVIPQNGPFGTVRGVVGREAPSPEPLVVDGVRIDTVSEWYTGTPPNSGAPAHELSHLLLGAPDLYIGSAWPHAAGAYSIMDRSYALVHLDPFEKLKLGWLDARVVTEPGEHTLGDVETRGEALVLYDPRRGPGEYFLVENRRRGESYDRVGGLPMDGLAVWHIVEDPALLADAPRPEGVGAEEWGRAGLRLLRANGGEPIDDAQALWDAPGTIITLRWIDGSPAGFTVTLGSDPGERVRVLVRVDAPH